MESAAEKDHGGFSHVELQEMKDHRIKVSLSVERSRSIKDTASASELRIAVGLRVFYVVSNRLGESGPVACVSSSHLTPSSKASQGSIYDAFVYCLSNTWVKGLSIYVPQLLQHTRVMAEGKHIKRTQPQAP